MGPYTCKHKCLQVSPDHEDVNWGPYSSKMRVYKIKGRFYNFGIRRYLKVVKRIPKLVTYKFLVTIYKVLLLDYNVRVHQIHNVVNHHFTMLWIHITRLGIKKNLKVVIMLQNLVNHTYFFSFLFLWYQKQLSNMRQITLNQFKCSFSEINLSKYIV